MKFDTKRHKRKKTNLASTIGWYFIILKSSFEHVKITVFEGTAMKITRTWLIRCDNFHTTVWCVVGSFPFFTVTMANVVCVAFLKFIKIHFLGELRSPEQHGFIQTQTCCLQN